MKKEEQKMTLKNKGLTRGSQTFRPPKEIAAWVHGVWDTEWGTWTMDGGGVWGTMGWIWLWDGYEKGQAV